MKISTKTEHLETVSAFLDKAALEQLIIDAVAKEARISLSRPGITTKVVFEDATRGSPEYTIGTQARVTMVIDHNAAHAEPQP